MKFIKEESGAVTADWLVMSMVILGLGAYAGSSLLQGANSIANDIRGNIKDAQFVSYSTDVTYDSVAYTIDLESVPRVCTASLDQNGVKTESCNTSIVAGGARVFYNMSDGTQWQKLVKTLTVYLADRQDADFTVETMTSWFNNLGIEVSAPSPTHKG